MNKSIKKRYLNKVVDFTLFFLVFLILQILHTNSLFPDMLLPYSWFLDLFVIITFGSVCFIFRPWLFDVIYLSIILFFIVVFMNVSATFNMTTGAVFSLSNMYFAKNPSALGDVMAESTAVNWLFSSLSVIIFVLFVVGMILIHNYCFKVSKEDIKAESTKHLSIRTLIAVSLSLILFTGYGVVSNNYTNKVHGINTIMVNRLEQFRNLGMLSYFNQEAAYLLTADKVNETEMKNYFKGGIHEANAFTGLLAENKPNVVNIMIETGDDLMMNEYLCPNLYNLLNNGILTTKNVSKNKTNMSEFIGIAGSAPIKGVQYSQTYNVPFGGPEIFNRLGYDTLFFHDMPLNRDIYDRHNVMPYLGFEESYFREDLFPGEPGWSFDGSYSQDSLAMGKVADVLLNKKKETNKPFYGFYTTLSMHGPYFEPKNKAKLNAVWGSKLDTLINEGKIVNPLAGTINEDCVRNYMMATMDMDLGLGILLDKFAEANELDNTLFAIYGDHEIYYKGADNIPLNRTLAGVGPHDNPSNPEMYKTFLAFVHPKLREKYDEIYPENAGNYNITTSPYNVLPTILDLVGVNYNPNYYVGHSLFDLEMQTTPQVHYTIEQAGFFNEDYWALSGKRIYNNFAKADSLQKQQAFLDEVKRVSDRAIMVDVIYTTDFFATRDFNDYN